MTTPTTNPSKTPSRFNFDATLPASLDQSGTALQILDDWSNGNAAVADLGIARMLAATMHDGPGTALETFATTGELHAEQALAELNDLIVPLEREAWVDALGRYIITAGDRS